MHLSRISRITFCLLLLAPALVVRAQELHAAQSPRIDVAITFDAERSLRSATPESFWMQGGSIELGTNTWRGLGIVANVTGAHTGAIGESSIPLSIVTTTFGPRYRWHADHRVSIYVEGLIGEGNGFKSLFPTVRGSETSANSLAAQAGGGLDYRLSQHVAVRAVEAAWQHTQLPNGTNNAQNDLRLGAGIVVGFGP
jgi:opacity protein-like surface antigen